MCDLVSIGRRCEATPVCNQSITPLDFKTHLYEISHSSCIWLEGLNVTIISIRDSRERRSQITQYASLNMVKWEFINSEIFVSIS